MYADIYMSQGDRKIAQVLILNEMKANLIFYLFVMKTHICQISVITSFLIFGFQMHRCRGFNVFISLDPIYLVVWIFSLIWGTQTSLTCFYAFCEICCLISLVIKMVCLWIRIDFCSNLNCGFCHMSVHKQ